MKTMNNNLVKKPDPTWAPMYCAMYPDIASLAREHGYAVAVHGSISRDFDLICIPWVKDVSPPSDVVEELIKRFCFKQIENFESKLHGRVAYTLSLGFGECFVDLSFMPTCSEKKPNTIIGDNTND